MTTVNKTIQIAATQDDGYDSTFLDTWSAIAAGAGKFGNWSLNIGLRFLNVGIPQGSVISSAKVTIISKTTSADSVALNIYGVDEDDCAVFSTATRPTVRDKTTAVTSWPLGTTQRTQNVSYDTPDITEVIQEIVDRAGWASGNAMGILIMNNASAAGKLDIYDYTDDSTKVAVLTIGVSSIFQGNANRDNNHEPVAVGVSNIDGETIVQIGADPATHRILSTDGSSGSDLGRDDAERDENSIPTLIAASSDDGITPVPLYIDPLTGELLIKST